MDWISEFLLKEGPAQMTVLFSQTLYTAKGGMFGSIHSECFYGVW